MTQKVQKQKKELVAAAVTHLEIPTLQKKKEETAKLFAAVFGWAITYDAMPNYGMTTNTQGKVSIGLPLRDEVTEPVSNLYIHVQDIDTALLTAKKFGAKVVSEKNMISEDIGFGASFKDLSGNIIGLFSPE